MSTSELHILMCSDRLQEKERSVRRSSPGHHSVTHSVSCPYLRTVTADSSETPVSAEAGRAESRKNLFSSYLISPSPLPSPSFCLHLSFHLPFFFCEKQNQSHSGGCVKRRWFAKDLEGFCKEAFWTSV